MQVLTPGAVSKNNYKIVLYFKIARPHPSRNILPPALHQCTAAQYPLTKHYRVQQVEQVISSYCTSASGVSVLYTHYKPDCFEVVRLTN